MTRVERDFPSGGLGERARRWLDGDPEVRAERPVRHAATVQLVRDAEDGAGVEVFMLRRVATMEFAPRTMVFPGGGVDPRDADEALARDHWAGPTPQQWAERMGRPAAVAQQLVVAAVREVFEECGVLLAGAGPDDVVRDLATPDWHADRVALEARELSLTDLLLRRGLVLRSDLLAYRAHWITPAFEPRRYDTAFFAALLPTGQHPDDRTTEADSAGWCRPADLLARLERGRVLMLPPTIVAVEQLAEATGAAALVAEQPEVWAISPELVEVEPGVVVLRAPVPATARGDATTEPVPLRAAGIRPEQV
ncbi:NUDIX hydrolase [Arsenicicoccus dermatophilus]|uniref:NUDIX hydrolase n=1 Tax=Arsenicicoccus dermatophilus TaxID=1076331 RepID=UPI001F4C9399|nr:NUDIX hydrolase [Arsenicicoccus dermatophilus]MCH8611710.1 NUDIX hydrolase [Arsenicicoccus dermatophilus]